MHTMLPVLVHIQANLGRDLSLDVLSRRAGLSPFHFHRKFLAEVGETPASYVARLRLERAAHRLHTFESGILTIALDCGYQNHETFSRAFRRRFGVSPSAWRTKRRRRGGDPIVAARTRVASTVPFALSDTRIVRLRQMPVAFIRHVGPYEDVPDSLFETIETWARKRRLPGPRIWVGIGHDAPGTTASDRLRFDAGLVTTGAFAPDGGIACQMLEEGDFALTTHVGPYHTLPQAYAEIFRRADRLRGHVLTGPPAVEFYRTVKVDARLLLNETDICLPVRRRLMRRAAER